MLDFSYSRAGSAAEAADRMKEDGVSVLAGGTTLLDLAKCGVERPNAVIDITHLSGLDTIAVDETGARIGALATMSRVADHPEILKSFPAVAQSLSLAASAQLRNMARIGGNLLQRTRCPYFRDPVTFDACNKRKPGSGCSAIGGVTRNHAVLGTSEHCIATYHGDLAVALAAFDAVIETDRRTIAIDDFFLTPGDRPDRETVLERGELITAIAIPSSPAARNSLYLKVRDRQSYEFAAASAAVGLELEADGQTIRDIRIGLGGVATKPWRASAIAMALTGKRLDRATIDAASRLSVESAVSYGGNSYKIALMPRVVTRAILTLATALNPQLTSQLGERP
ncbi:xanthine dehydrogenase family protein subunit M [Rhizobium sp. SSA_523]|uniref:FAD binding domain-containing protein n=1 Tax=Rhizobium sp. SSA_523 TaxID=2952477 RepID=UPI002090C9B9|nr:xanthine dehydrogenase family protein subunit M [Rhizobium sp. SSA_523]MCO5732279.1 xanthine dehydrogenase family protein subunit M [Rhizobium sp. SSA_523]WKC21318.1 xanthine dehydrogenase family protein subunit M [Rhizobium sp. SSA_523]